MFRFLAGVATGWMLARAPPTADEMKVWVDHVFTTVKNLLPESPKAA